MSTLIFLPLRNRTGQVVKRIPSHLIVAMTAWAGRLTTVAIQFISIRVLLEGIGSQQYAVFVLLQALSTWFILSDFGIGYGLQNFISEKRVKQESYGDYIVATALIMVFVVILLCLAFIPISAWLSREYLVSFQFLDDGEKYTFFYITVVIGVLTGIGNIATKIWYAHHKGYYSNILPAFSAIVGLSCIVLIVRSDIEDKLLWCVVAFLGANALFLLAAFVVITLKYMRGSHHVSRVTVAALIHRGSRFFVFGLMAALTLQVDYIVIAKVLSPDDIVIYNIASKIFSLVLFVYSAVLLALWPVCAEMIVKNRWDDVFRMVRNYILFGVAVTLLSTALLAILMPYIVGIISPSEHITVPLSLILLLGGYNLVRVWTDTFAMVLQSMNHTKPLFRFVPLQAVMSIVFQLLLSHLYGLNGIVIGLICSFILSVSWGLPMALKQHARQCATPHRDATGPTHTTEV